MIYTYQLKYSLLLLIIPLIFCIHSTAVAQLDYEYAIFKVRGLGIDGDYPWGTNNHGQVVGSYTTQYSEIHPFIWSIGEESIDIGTFGGSIGEARGVNNAGVVTGEAYDAQGEIRAFRWDPSSGIEDIGTLGGDGAVANSINETGQICGTAAMENAYAHAFLWEDGKMMDLSPSFPEEYSTAWGINNHGVVVGEFRVNAAMWKDGEYIDLGFSGVALDINDLDQVVGQAGVSSAFIWADGVKYDPTKSGFGKDGIAYAINNKSEVVGLASQGPQEFAFIWTPNKGLRILDDLIPPNNFARLLSAHDIAENGIITAWTRNFHGYFARWAVVLIPVKPEILLSDPIPGIAGEINRWKVSQVTPGAEVTLYYSLEGGGAIVEGCDKMDAVLQLQNPKFAQSVIANANGIAYFDIHVVNKASNLGTILIQAIDENNCQESQLQVVEF